MAKDHQMATRAPSDSSQIAAHASVFEEGKVEIRIANSLPGRKEGKDDASFNPTQVFKRDLSILVLSVFGRLRAADVEERRKKREQRAQETGRQLPEARKPGLKILDALAANGMRSIRYSKELARGREGVRIVVANDMDLRAIEHIKQNLIHNGIGEGQMEVTNEDASAHMYTRRARGYCGMGEDAYDVVDIDPNGSASVFLDAAVQSVADGGLLCVTSTDAPVLGGNNPETCFARYGGSALKSGYTHEMALRLVLHAVASAAAKYGREAHALLCCSIDFYVRIFVRITDSLARVKYHASKTAVVHQCSQCESFFSQAMGEASLGEDVKDNQRFKSARVATPGEVCPECQSRLKLGGPFHAGPLYDKDFVQQCLCACEPAAAAELSGITSWKKISGLLSAIAEEHNDMVFFYRLPQLCRGLKLTPIPIKQFRGTLKALGYRVSHFHRDPEAIKTDAPNAVVYDLMRLWSQEHPPKSQPLPDLLKKEFTLKRPIEWKTEEDAPKAKTAKIIPKDHTKDHTKDQTKDQTKDHTEDHTKDHTKDHTENHTKDHTSVKPDAGPHRDTHGENGSGTSPDAPGAL